MTSGAGTVTPTTEGDVLRQHRGRLRGLEGLGDGQWHTVGGTDEPAYVGGWFGSAQFLRTSQGWLRLRGQVNGGADGTVIFTLPPGFRPTVIPEPFIVAVMPSGIAKVLVNLDGTVVCVARNTTIL